MYMRPQSLKISAMGSLENATDSCRNPAFIRRYASLTVQSGDTSPGRGKIRA